MDLDKGDSMYFGSTPLRPPCEGEFSSSEPLPSLHYWNGNEWSPLPNLRRESVAPDSDVPLPREHLTWDVPDDWVPRTVGDSAEGYWIRAPAPKRATGWERFLQRLKRAKWHVQRFWYMSILGRCWCWKRPAGMPAPCPWKDEIHHDATPCTCCDECAKRCAGDI